MSPFRLTTFDKIKQNKICFSQRQSLTMLTLKACATLPAHECFCLGAEFYYVASKTR